MRTISGSVFETLHRRKSYTGNGLACCRRVLDSDRDLTIGGGGEGGGERRALPFEDIFFDIMGAKIFVL